MRPSPLRSCLLSLAALGALAAPARADFHLVKVVEVFAGTPAAPDAQYVLTQMYVADQGNLLGHKLNAYNAAGALIGTFTFDGSVTNPKPNQTKIFIATPQAAALFNLPADLTMSADVLAAGGKVCFETIDCVAWGNYSGSSTGVGTPFGTPNPLPAARAIKRRLDISGSPTTLDSTDDTNDSTNDFVLAMPAPRNSAGTFGTTPASTCGNGAIEGLEQCDDHNLANGDSCSSTCETTTPVTSISIADASVSEGNAGTKLMTFTVSLSQPSAAPVTYSIATADGTASAGSDYVARALAGETIPAGMTSKTFDVTINGDTLVEPLETVIVNLGAVTGASVADGQAMGLVQNDDTATLSIGDAAIAEGNAGSTFLVFTLSLDKPSSSPVTYNLATSDGTATGSGGDYFPLGQGGQSIPAGTTSKTVAIEVFGDAVVEANEAFNVTLSAVSGAVLGDGAALGFIINDDGPVLSIADVNVGETNSGTRVANFTAKLSQPAAGNVGFTIATSNAGAIAPTDYVARTLTAQVIPAGQTTYAFAVTVNGDTAVEQNENFVVKLSAVTGPVTVADGTALGTILNDDGPTLSINDVTLVEGNAGTFSLNFNVTMSQFVGFPVTYTLSTANGSAVAGSDFVGRTFADTLPAGMTSKVFSVITNGDLAVEGNEVFYVNITNTSGASAWDGQGQGGIVNDDGPTLSIADLGLVEGNTGTRSLAFVVKLSQPAPAPVTYSINTLDGTATVANADYVARSLVGETIPTGGLSRAFTVTSNGDTAVEPNENLQVKLTAATGASIFDGLALGTLTNDDGPTLVVGDVAVNEGNSGTSTATFTVSLTQAAAVPVTYNISTANGSAVAGSDYVAKGAVGETIPAGSLGRTFVVTINGDTAFEGAETFTVNLAQASGATIKDAQGVGTINNDD
jgi:cysteine-rich repeat protein